MSSQATSTPEPSQPQQARALDLSRGPLRIEASPAPLPDTALRARERIPTVIVHDHEAIARIVAGRIANLIRERAADGRQLVLGLATGSTPIGVYRELIRRHREEKAKRGRGRMDEKYSVHFDSESVAGDRLP